MSRELQTGDGRIMNYGKEKIRVLRTYGTPLEGIEPIPESSFEGRPNTLFGMEVRVQVEGEDFLPSFSEGDNSMVVATDSMKNFVHDHMGEYDGATLEGFLKYVGTELIQKYDQMEAVEVSATEIPFEECSVPTEDGPDASELVFTVSDNESGYGELYIDTGDDGPAIEDHSSGVTGIELMKAKDNSFTDFVQDEYTTLPERENRTLYIQLDIFWSYANAEDALGEDPEQYVPAEQVRDIAQAVFDEYDVNSIQDLLYQVGLRVLERFPQLESVSFESKNKTWIGVRDDLEGDSKVLREPDIPTGFQQFSMTQDDLENKTE